MQKNASLNGAGVLSWMCTNWMKERLIGGKNGEGSRLKLRFDEVSQ